MAPSVIYSHSIYEASFVANISKLHLEISWQWSRCMDGVHSIVCLQECMCQYVEG